MTLIDRRRFLQLGAGAALGYCTGALGALSGCSKSSQPIIGAQTARWGAPGAGQSAGMFDAARIPDGLLEVFVLGGLSPWDTFYTVPEFGNPEAGGPYANSQYWLFHDDVESPKALFDRCGGGDRAMFAPFALDAAQIQVNLGPYIYPLRDRPDILKRMRVWVVSHELEPHHAAIPLAMTGRGRGTLGMASLGAHLERYHQDLAPGRAAPWSYALYQTSLDIDGNADAASAVGLHRASARPMSVRLGPENPLAEQLQRKAVGGYQQRLDALVAHYGAQLTGRINGVRAPAVSDFAAARRGMQSAGALAGLLTPEVLSSVNASACLEASLVDQTTTSLRLAAHLLTSSVSPAKYVNVLEGGLYPDPTGLGYDTHRNHVLWSARNVVHMAKRLTEIINEPGEADPQKLDLDRHTVLINTEFGRTPTREFTKVNPDGSGTDHWPWGYVVIAFGGPFDEERRGIVGSIGEDARAIESISPTEHRAAMLQMMGAWPFAQESFAVSEVRGGDLASELESALWLREHVLGYGS